MSTCPTTPYKEKINPFSNQVAVVGDKINPFSILQICAHLNQENGFAILLEDYNYILLT